ncbi:MAG TPA: alpha/beta hydrolase [Candidatus Nitrosocosmicus sp.]
MKIVFNDPTFSLLLLRTIAETYYKGADIGECLSTAYRIIEGDFESWYEEWLKTARRIHSYADECMSKDHTISARDAYLRASNYYRTAEFLLVEPEDPRIQNTIDLSKECFRKAVPLFPFVVDCIEIPYKETTLPGYFYHAPKEHINHKNKQYDNKNDNEKKGINYNETTTVDDPPTLIVHGGFDSTLEELYSSAAAPALERGYNCLAFEGPGQGNVIRKQKIPFRYDWEKVVTPVMEFMISKKKEFHIDPKRIVLMGISMGGYLAARAAAFEPRISATILYNGVFDGYDAIKSGFPTSLLDEIERGNSEFVNTELTNLMESDSNVKFNMKHGMWTTGTSSPYELIIGAKELSSKDILKNIKSPTLVLEGEKDDSFPGQPKKVFEGLVSLPPSLKKYIIFTREEGAEEHCQSGAPAITNQRIFDWLDETFNNKHGYQSLK